MSFKSPIIRSHFACYLISDEVGMSSKFLLCLLAICSRGAVVKIVLHSVSFKKMCQYFIIPQQTKFREISWNPSVRLSICPSVPVHIILFPPFFLKTSKLRYVHVLHRIVWKEHSVFLRCTPRPAILIQIKQDLTILWPFEYVMVKMEHGHRKNW